jgi:hypothetical protein
MLHDRVAFCVAGKPAADERLEKHVTAHKPDLVVVPRGLLAGICILEHMLC